MEIVKVEGGSAYLLAIKELFEAYATELDEDLGFQHLEEELKNPLLKYGPPGGCLLVALQQGKPVGCIAYRQVDAHTCEMKRLYVQPLYKQQGIAHALVDALLLEAKRNSYKVMLLDTLAKLQPALQLYLQYGFHRTEPYYHNPLPGVVFLKIDL